MGMGYLWGTAYHSAWEQGSVLNLGRGKGAGGSWGGDAALYRGLLQWVGVLTFNPHSDPTQPSVHSTDTYWMLMQLSGAMLSNEVEMGPLPVISQQFGDRDGMGNQTRRTSLGIAFSLCSFRAGEQYMDCLELIMQVLLRKKWVNGIHRGSPWCPPCHPSGIDVGILQDLIS